MVLMDGEADELMMLCDSAAEAGKQRRGRRWLEEVGNQVKPEK